MPADPGRQISGSTAQSRAFFQAARLNFLLTAAVLLSAFACRAKPSWNRDRPIPDLRFPYGQARINSSTFAFPRGKGPHSIVFFHPRRLLARESMISLMLGIFAAARKKSA